MCFAHVARFSREHVRIRITPSDGSACKSDVSPSAHRRLRVCDFPHSDAVTTFFASKDFLLYFLPMFTYSQRTVGQ
jgi:hypothetical protein